MSGAFDDKQRCATKMSKPSVFVSSSLEGLKLARELARQLESTAAVTLWSEGVFHPGKTVTESLTEAAGRNDFAVFVFTTDDVVLTRSTSPRLNVIFEVGFFAGSIGLSRTFLVVPNQPELRLPTDLAGIMYLPIARYDKRQDLAATIAPAAAAIAKTIADVGARVDYPSKFVSCFISYSWNDKEFAARLYDDLQQVGVRCWLDAKEMKAGERIYDQIDRAIQVHDKVLLILSQASVKSQWVRQEVRNALGLERQRHTTVLFPLRVDDAVLSLKGTPELKSLRERFIVDFSSWQDKNHYQRAFSSLMRDLAISASVESGR